MAPGLEQLVKCYSYSLRGSDPEGTMRAWLLCALAVQVGAGGAGIPLWY